MFIRYIYSYKIWRKNASKLSSTLWIFFILLRTRFTKQNPVMVEVVEAEKTTELVSIGTFQQGSEKR